jgi:hypothetical protein
LSIFEAKCVQEVDAFAHRAESSSTRDAVLVDVMRLLILPTALLAFLLMLALVGCGGGGGY